MHYKNLAECVSDLESAGHLIRIKEEVDANLEMAAIHLRVFENNGPAILFENIKNCQFKAVSNLFGTMDRSRFMFRKTLSKVQQIVKFKQEPWLAVKHPIAALHALKSIPKKSLFHPVLFAETTIDQLPQLKCWPMDGGAFVTLPLVYTEDIDSPGIFNSNLGMYRIQLSGNEYISNKEVGLHYQLHRGIGVHQTKANERGAPLKVSVFVGGPPAHIFSSVMPLPEGMSELLFAGILGGKRFRYTYRDGYCISSDADFVICGEVAKGATKPEGPFGDHLGYYSLTHNFPVMNVHKVWHRKDAIWPFTVVGRPPQEDTAFGNLIHEITGDILSQQIPGLKEVHAVDAAGVHPLLLAIGSERYTPYIEERKPQEILTIANHILGFGQMSLAKYLFIAAHEDNAELSTHKEVEYFTHILERINWATDLHFHTNTTIDTLDYSGDSINAGSKVVMAAAGNKKRELGKSINDLGKLPDGLQLRFVMPGVLSVNGAKYENKNKTENEVKILCETIKASIDHQKFPLIILADDADFVAQSISNFVWTSFTRSNPASDIFGVDSFIENKHWGCRGSLIIDARIKPHHAPLLVKDPEIERVDKLGEKGKSLYGII